MMTKSLPRELISLQPKFSGPGRADTTCPILAGDSTISCHRSSSKQKWADVAAPAVSAAPAATVDQRCRVGSTWRVSAADQNAAALSQSWVQDEVVKRCVPLRTPDIWFRSRHLHQRNVPHTDTS